MEGQLNGVTPRIAARYHTTNSHTNESVQRHAEVALQAIWIFALHKSTEAHCVWSNGVERRQEGN